MIAGRGQLALDALGRLDAARARAARGPSGRCRGWSRTARRWRRATSSASATMSKSGSRSRIWRCRPGTGRGRRRRGSATRSSDGCADRGCPDGDRDRCVLGLIRSPFCVGHRDSQPDDRADIWPRTYFKTCADQLGPLAHELQTEVATASRRDGSGIEPATVVADLQHPVATVQRVCDHDVRRARVLADILQRLLHHAKDDRLRGLGEVVGRRRELGGDLQARQRGLWRRCRRSSRPGRARRAAAAAAG